MSGESGLSNCERTGHRLLVVIDRVQDMGGAEGSTMLLIRGLHQKRVPLGVVGLDGITLRAHDRLVAEGVRFFQPAHPGFLSSVRCVLRAIRAVRPALIHSTLARSDLAARVAGILAGVPVMTSIVSVPYGEQARAVARSRTKLNAYRALDGFLSRHATFRFHAISQASADAAVRALRIDPDRITLVPRGRSDTDLGRRSEARRQRARSALGLRPDDVIVLNVAREDLLKGQSYLTGAVNTLTTHQGLPLHLVIAGRNGSASADLDASVAALGIADRVHRLGVRHDVPELLCAADVFAFPSLHEGLGGALLEALALEVPIVAFDDPAVREAVGDAGVLVPLCDGAAFTEALGALLDDVVWRADLARRGRARFEERFTDGRYIASMLELYTAAWSSVSSGYRDPLSFIRGNGHAAR